MENEVLKVIKERRSVTKFLPSALDMEVLKQILDAGRWAPSWINSQPWIFILVTDRLLKRRIGEIASRKTAFAKGRLMEDSAAVIVVAVNPAIDPNHHVEDGAIATQNMALAAYSLGYGSYYLGIFGDKDGINVVEDEIKKELDMPENLKIVSVLPVGIPETTRQSTRTELREIVHLNKYGKPIPK